MIRFKGHLIIQTMFMEGFSNGINVDNTTDNYVLPWLNAVRAVNPQQVMIYTIDRETPDHGLKKASPEKLNAIAEKVKDLGIACSVSY